MKLTSGFHPLQTQKLHRQGRKLLYQRDDGKYELYDDMFDITLHFKSWQEHKDFCDILEQITKTDIQNSEDVVILSKEECKDYISREAAMMSLTGEWTEKRDELIHKALVRIKALPSLAERKEEHDQ